MLPIVDKYTGTTVFVPGEEFLPIKDILAIKRAHCSTTIPALHILQSRNKDIFRTIKQGIDP